MVTCYRTTTGCKKIEKFCKRTKGGARREGRGGEGKGGGSRMK
jgi:hypothetical protein